MPVQAPYSQPNIPQYQEPEFHALKEALKWLEESSPSHLINPSLKEISEAATLLGLNDISKQGKVISVAGSNGKGSTCFFTESIALEHNINVGLYTSPHLISFNERIRIDGKNISDGDLLKAFNSVFNCVQTHKLTLSYFEFTTLCALWSFKQAGCELIILEVGLGGRLDATNIIDNDCAVITSISLEHQQWLGNSLGAIAREKAGIIKMHKKAVLMDTLPEECYRIAEENKAHVLLNQREFSIDATHHTYSYNAGDRTYKLALNLTHLLQQTYAAQKTKFNNLSLALTSLFAIGLHLDEQKINRALQKIQLKGRLEPYTHNYFTGWLDVAHNPESVTNLALFLSHLPQQVNAIFSCLDDKEIDAIIGIIAPYIHQWRIVQLDTVRAMDNKKIEEALLTHGIEEHMISVSDEKNCMNDFNDQREVIIFGSFFLIGIAKQHLEKRL